MIYIQSDADRKMAHHFDCACAMYGAIEECLDYRLTSFAEVESGKFDRLIRTNLFIGSVEFMTEVLKRVGIHDPRVPVNSNRPFETITLREARLRAKAGEKIFIKPFQIKLFTGFVIDQMQYTSIKDISDDTPVMAYGVIDIESEWRIYVHKHSIVDSKNYSGDLFVNPDYSYVNKLIRNNKDTFPCAYTIDIGILYDDSNVVVEYNDMWAIGNYGVPNDLYLKMLKHRYFEIIKNGK